MSTRKIKDAKDLSTNELIYFKGHAQATYMSNGATVEDAINSIAGSGNGGSSVGNTYTKSEIDSFVGALNTNKQDTLVSGTSIKTVNGESLLGSGNILAGAKPLSTFTATSISLTPNVYYRKTNTSSSLTITLESPANPSILNEYLIEFTVASGGTTVSLPSSVKWANGEAPTFQANAIYQISIVNNLGVYTKFN